MEAGGCVPILATWGSYSPVSTAVLQGKFGHCNMYLVSPFFNPLPTTGMTLVLFCDFEEISNATPHISKQPTLRHCRAPIPARRISLDGERQASFCCFPPRSEHWLIRVIPRPRCSVSYCRISTYLVQGMVILDFEAVLNE